MSEGKFSNTKLEFETSRLMLRPISLNDVEGLFSLFSDPEIIRYLAPSKPLQRCDVEIALCSMIAHWERYGFGRMAIHCKTSGAMIGYSGLRNLEGTAEIIYTIAKQYWGKGLATEAAKASLRFGFETLQFDRIAAITRPENLVSRHILSKIGLTYKGEARFYGHMLAYYEIAKQDYVIDDSFYYKLNMVGPLRLGAKLESISAQVS